MRPILPAALALASCLSLRAQEQRNEERRDDSYLAGYAVAVLERELGVPKAIVEVKGGVVTVHSDDLGNVDAERVRQMLARIPGVVRVEVDTREPAEGARDSAAARAVVHPEGAGFLLRSPLLFEPLHADPRWPHFSAAYQIFRGNEDLEQVAATSFGESFSFFRETTKGGSQWEIGVQAGVFAIFDLDSASTDLINADYFIGPAFTWRKDRLSALARVYHQSSHLGDEYLLRTRATRINLSYEVIDLLGSWDVTDALRVYGGAGYILHSYTPLKRWLAEAGVELFGPPLGGAGLRPLAALDAKFRQEADWQGDLSARAGVQLQDAAAHGIRMQILLEYYRGSSPNGQFFEQDIESYGIGLHFYF